MQRRSRQPALRSLVTFETAARLGSFRAAAEELHLTPSAVSHQITGLERQLGIELFARVGRAVALTPRGARYFERIHRILATLEEATRETLHAAASEVVTIHTPPSLASKWLLPRLQGFMQAHRHVEVRLRAETGRAGFSWDSVDLAILYSDPGAVDENAAPLLEEQIQPLCSPRTLHKRPIKDPSDVLGHLLIHTTYNLVTWRHWFIAQGVRGYGRCEGIQIDPSHVAIEAATNEFGIVLESDVLAHDELASGRLIAPLRDHAMKRTSYVLAWSPRMPLDPTAKLFRDWLLTAAKVRTPQNWVYGHSSTIAANLR